jgi:hypothetical protein
MSQSLSMCNGVQQQFHVRWYSCHLSTCNGVQQQFHVRWCSCHFLRVTVSNKFHVRWCSCHCLRVMVSNNSFMSDDVPVIVYVQWCPTTISCQMMFLSLSTCNGVQQQFHVRWCSSHCLRVMMSNNNFMLDDVRVICLCVMVSNNSFMSDDVPVIVYV